VKRIVLMYRQFGPYHVARLRFCREFFAKRGLDIVGMELFRKQLTYNWEAAPADAGIVRCDFTPVRGDALRRSDIPKLLWRLKREKPAAVFVSGWSTTDALSTHALCSAMRVPRILVSDSWAKEGTRPAYKEKTKSLILRGIAAAFVAGTPQADYLLRLGMQRESLFIGCDAVDNAHFASATSNRPWGYRLLTVARLEPPKNLLRAAEAFLQFLSEDTGRFPWFWQIVGYGSLEPKLRELAIRSRGRIALAKGRGYEELPATYAGANLYWQPSISDTWGLVVNEAMAAGLPVLVSDHCGCAEDLVDAGVGWTFDPRSTASIVVGLQRAAADWRRWGDMGRAAQHKIADWGLERFAHGAYDAAIHAIGMQR
jgi:glycosyltransferase involved in cell wall biosynthesis